MKKKSKKNNLFLVSLHRKSLLTNYQKSVENSVPLKLIRKELDKTRKKIRVWGIVDTKDNFRIWKEIKKQDLIIFLHNKKFFSKANVVDTKKSDSISKDIWNDNLFNENRNLLIFLEKIEPINLDYDACIPSIIDPNMSDAYYFAIMNVNKEKRNFLTSTFGSIEKAIEFLANPKNKNSSISEYLTENQLKEEVDITIKQSTSKQRKGQNKFRENILLNFNHTCAICSLKDTELLEAAHIIPVEDKILAGKTKNGICFCSNCHKMFDKGFFSFDENYNVIVSNQKKISNKILELLKDKKMGRAKMLPSKEYIALHRAKFGIV